MERDLRGALVEASRKRIIVSNAPLEVAFHLALAFLSSLTELKFLLCQSPTVKTAGHFQDRLTLYTLRRAQLRSLHEQAHLPTIHETGILIVPLKLMGILAAHESGAEISDLDKS